MLDRIIAKGDSVCLSVRLSDTLLIHVKMVKNIETHFKPYDRKVF